MQLCLCTHRIFALAVCLFISLVAAQDLGPTLAEQQDTDEEHKGLFPLQRADYITFTLVFFTLILAAGAGLGGGALLVAIYMLVLGEDPSVVVGLSNTTIFGGALANIVFNWNSRHPFADRPLIDWSLIMMMEPATMLGALVGSFANQIVNARVSTACLVVLLFCVACRTASKAWDIHNYNHGECQPTDSGTPTRRTGAEAASARTESANATKITMPPPRQGVTTTI